MNTIKPSKLYSTMKITNSLAVHTFDQAMSIGHWCGQNLSEHEWSIELVNFAPPKYLFKFEDPQLRTLAALNS